MRVSLCPITEENWMEAAALRVKDEQRAFAASALGILARGYVYRNCRAQVYAVTAYAQIVGLMLVRDLDEEPACYDLQQFMMDARFQGRGMGQQALALLLERLKTERRYPRVEVCVKRDDAAALHVYQKAGFADGGYVDPAAPGSVNLVYEL